MGTHKSRRTFNTITAFLAAAVVIWKQPENIPAFLGWLSAGVAWGLTVMV